MGSSGQSSGCPVDHGKNHNDKCPVDHHSTTTQQQQQQQQQQAVKSTSWNPVNWLSSEKKTLSSSSSSAAAAASECPVKHSGKTTSSLDSCPVKHGASINNNSTASSSSPFPSSLPLPPSLEESARHAQTPHPDQRIPLSTHRVVSTIPRADELRQENERSAPHQPASSQQWVYPSEQQFYNAMKRKGWSHVEESTIPLVVKIHNAVNEQGWREVSKWERELHGNTSPRLVRFLGRPNDMSPKAFLNTYVWQYNPPFDRHDWYVDRGDGKEPKRYVIDFYNGNDGSQYRSGGNPLTNMMLFLRGTPREAGRQDPASLPPRPPAMYLDVRPAIDSPEVVVDRCKMFFMESFPGIYEAMKQSRTAAAAAETKTAAATTNSTNGANVNATSAAAPRP